MKLARFTHAGNTRIGAVDGDAIVDLTDGGLPDNLIDLLEGGDDALAAARSAAADGPRVALADVRLEAPIARPPKLLAIGLNYRKHAEEGGMPIPEQPVVFNKQSTSVTGPYDAIHRPPESPFFDYEGELAVVIGRRCRRVPPESARSVIAGYAVANDVSVRDWQMRSPTMRSASSPTTFVAVSRSLLRCLMVPAKLRSRSG